MITTIDIGNILYRDCKVFGIGIVPSGKTLTGELEAERITIHPKRQQSETYWKKSFVEVNFCVPDLRPGEAHSIRLGELERQAAAILDGVIGVHDGTRYCYSVESIGTEADTVLKCHFVNVRILFEVLNTRL